ncbi:hypothetical protein KKF61_06665 [Patescibacteria group bacterium]|nr:hypothetical protein [Patescibacteria group bacterium]
MKKKILILVFIFLFSFVFVSSVNAVSSTEKLPGKFTYAWEWADLHLFSWSAESKVEKLNEYATKRAENMATAVEIDKTEAIDDLSQRYSNLTETLNKTISEKEIKNKATIVETVQKDVLEQQRVLSGVRQNLTNESQKNTVANIQETAVNQLKNNIIVVNDETTAENFTNQVVNVWRDPDGIVTEEKATRVYAVGTESTDNTGNNKVIIDGGQAIINQDNSGDLLIEYAPGTGPNSVTTDSGQKICKIQLDNGTTVDSYTAGSNVVIGGTNGTASNVIVNTISDVVSGQINVVVDNKIEISNIKVEGGLPNVVSDDIEANNMEVKENINSNSGNSGTNSVEVEDSTISDTVIE